MSFSRHGGIGAGVKGMIGMMPASTQVGVIALLAGLSVVWVGRRILNRIRVKSLIRNIPGPTTDSWLAGNFPEVYDVTNIQWHHETTRKYGNIVQVNGMFGDEQIYVTDPRALYHIIVKEQNIFEEPQSLLIMNSVLLGDGLIATIGDYHRFQRKVLNPVFSINHMRALAPIFHGVTTKLCSVIEAKLLTGPPKQEINVYEWAGRASLEFIARGGLGTSLDSMVEGETSDYTKLSKELVPTVSRLHVPMQLLPIVRPLFKLIPESIRSILLRHSPFPAVRKLKSITDRITATSQEVLDRKKAEVIAEIENSKGEKGRDILSILLRANSKAAANDRLDDEEVVAHITTLIFAAQDTTSSAISRTLLVLAKNAEAQEKVRKEIRLARSVKAENEEWDYDELMRLPYLDAVCRETLRLHNPVSWIWRVARKPTTLPLLRPIKGTDGQLITSIPVAKNQGFIIGIAAANRDEAVWGPDAWEWKPERWLEPGVVNVEAELSLKGGDEWKAGLLDSESVREARYPGVYSGMMTFSGGGRSCIGFKFALLSLKLVLATLLERFSFEPGDEEIAFNMNHIASPVIKGKEKESPRLPLKVSLAS